MGERHLCNIFYDIAIIGRGGKSCGMKIQLYGGHSKRLEERAKGERASDTR